MKSQLLSVLQAARARRRRVALVTDLASGAQALLATDARELLPQEVSDSGSDLEVGPELGALAAQALDSESSRLLELAGERFFVQVFHPALRMAVVGAVHIAQPLLSIASQAGYAVTLIDPRSAWATVDRFPDVRIDRRWPAEALAELSPDRRTAIVTLTHDPKLDDPALVAALESAAFYVGALGSRRTQARRIERLKALGVADAALSRIHGPVGLDIGAVSPAEIAISIMAEITQRLGESRES